MASLIPGYEYDIFISYRQKDNKGDRWVSEFVESLKTELEATFKEEISVYFDINPHDGLLETHDVDASLKEKLKCLVFIPIISRTYCDPKSFAWEHEFKAFVEEASKDQYGLKVKLQGGNVGSRILPVQINDLNTVDKKLIESELRGFLRAIDFIYKEPGVNRPLASEDDEKKNLANTRYRNQINKVANAIDEILQGMKSFQTAPELDKKIESDVSKKSYKKETKKEYLKSFKLNKPKFLSGAAILVILIAVGVIIYPKIFKPDTLDRTRASGERISVAVMPFQNLTNDTIWGIWQKGIQNELITALTNTEELKVRQTGTINSVLLSKSITNYASMSPSVAKSVSQNLDAIIFIYGSIKQVGKTIRINAQLIDSKTEDTYRSFQIDGNPENILGVIDSLSAMIRDYLIISKLKNNYNFKSYPSTNSPEAFRCFSYGGKAISNNDFPAAIKMYSQAIAIDSNYYAAAYLLSCSYLNQSNSGETDLCLSDAKKWCLWLFKKRDAMPITLKIETDILYATCYETPNEVIKYTKQLQEIDDRYQDFHWDYGRLYSNLNQFDKAIPEFEKALEQYDKESLYKPIMVMFYYQLGKAYHQTGQLRKERKLYDKIERYFPNETNLIRNRAVLSLTEKDTISANKCIAKFINICKESSFTESDITIGIGYIYEMGGYLEKAEKYYRKALSLEPESPMNMNVLAYFLIDKDRNINEGLGLVKKVLSLSPDNYSYLDTKGWGLYKQDKYQEALKLLERSWDLKPLYDQELYLHLEAAKKAVANQKNN